MSESIIREPEPFEMVLIPLTLWGRIKVAWWVLTKRAAAVVNFKTARKKRYHLAEFCEPIEP